MHPQSHRQQDGIIIILTIIIIGFLLSMTLVLSAIFIPKVKTSAEIKRSTTAAYAAESAIEWCLYISRKGAIAAPVMQNGATYTPNLPASCVSPLKAIGTFQGVSRAFEVSGF